MALQRDPLPDTRKSITRRFSLPYKREDGTVERMKIYFTIGMYDDGRLGEVFIRADRSGSLASGALDAVAMMLSISLQYGVPLHVMLDKIRHSRFDPQGVTRDGEFPSASSVLDLLAQWLLKMFPETSA